ncbi:MAG TPA: VacJ family lipoprotein [Rhizomicrobium sp.]|nr:VacJ family lipoprotein [Rhizomicrobium sp.]
MAPKFRHLAALLLALAAAGCTTTTPPPSQMGLDPNDPYEAQNRKVFAFNMKLDEYVALPVAKFYVHVVPEPARDGVHNFLANLDVPITFGNDVLQGAADHAAQSLGRFVINSSIGVGGLIDVAQKIGIPEHDADFGETLGVWGVGPGPYLVLPILGPSDPRDAVGYGVDIAMDPLTWISWRSSTYFLIGRGVLKFVDERSRNIGTLDELERSSVDLYATLRSLYRQHREAEIHGGQPSLENLPNF